MSNIDSLLKEIFFLGSISQNIILNVLEERKTSKSCILYVTNEVTENSFYFQKANDATLRRQRYL